MLKLIEKSDIILIKEPDVFDAIPEGCNPLNAHTERPACIHFGIVTDKSEYVGIHHSTTENLQPPAVLAHLTPLAVADETGNVNVGTRLRERKERWPEFVFQTASVELLDERDQRSLQVAERHSFVYVQSFNLMKYAEAA